MKLYQAYQLLHFSIQKYSKVQKGIRKPFLSQSLKVLFKTSSFKLTLFTILLPNQVTFQTKGLNN